MKKKIIILSCLISLILMISCIAVLAAVIKIEYDYDVTLDAPSFEISDDGKIIQAANNIHKVDIENSTFDILLKINNEYLITNNVSNENKANVVKIYPKNLKYVIDGNAKTVIYQNEFVKNFNELKLASYSSYYNNLIDYITNSDIMYASKLIVLGQINIDDDFTISRPTSIEILDGGKIILNNNLTLLNSHPGTYSLKALDSNSISTSSDNDYKIYLKIEKANYDIDDNFKRYIYTENENIIDEITIDDAEKFILNYLPNYLTDYIYLPKTFMSSNITFEYLNFNGDCSNLSLEKTIEIVIKKGSQSKTVTKNIIFGDSDEAISLIIAKELSNINSFKDYNLLKLFKDLKIKKNLVLNVSNGAYFVVNDLNSTNELNISYNDGFRLENGDSINSLVIRRNMSDNYNYELTINGVLSNIYLDIPSTIEKIEYLKQYVRPYVITNENLAYNIIYNKEEENSIDGEVSNITATYFGNQKIFNGKLFANLNFKIMNGNNLFTDYDILEDGAIKLKEGFNSLDFTNMRIIYSDGETKLFEVLLVKSLNSTSGDDVDFTSNNPFDALFTESTNWLNNNTFIMPNDQSYNNHYARIIITSINGKPYNYDNHLEKITVRDKTFDVKTHNMVKITGKKITNDNSSATTNNGIEYFKNIEIEINHDYVSTSNTIVAIKCELYNSGAKEIVATHNYTFTIPGILKCGNNTNISDNKSPNVFVDDVFYTNVINYFKSDDNYKSYYTVSNNESYILANVKTILEFSPKFTVSKAVDISGLEMFTSANKIILDDIKISNLTTFKYFNATSLKVLSLKNCSLNGNILSNNLYGIELEELLLDNNSFATLDNFNGSFFRTIKKLSITNCSLISINGLESIIYVEKLYINNNNIENFESLKKMKYLKEVYLYGNNGSSNYYGTNGLVNKSVYYWIIKTSGVNIYNSENTVINDSYFDGIENKILALNAIVLPTKISSSEKEKIINNFSNFVDSKTNFTYSIEFGSNSFIIKCEDSSSAAYREFYYIEG